VGKLSQKAGQAKERGGRLLKQAIYRGGREIVKLERSGAAGCGTLLCTRIITEGRGRGGRE